MSILYCMQFGIVAALKGEKKGRAAIMAIEETIQAFSVEIGAQDSS
nr:hypothetical protein [uncultured Pseudodesulfovibrio sp.]